MSAVQNDYLFHSRNLDSIHPLSKNTEKTLQQYAFGPKLSGGCLTYQSLAERVEYLKNLQYQFEQETIHLSNGDRFRAVLKCAYKVFLATTLLLSGIAVVALGVLTLTSPVGIFAKTSTLAVLLKTGAIAVSAKILGALAYNEYRKVVKACRSAKKVFARPTPDRLKKELQELSTKEIKPEETEQMIALENLLKEKIQELSRSSSNGSRIGVNVTHPEKEIESLQSALVDVQRLRMAISG